MDKRRKWISVLLEEGLQIGVLSPEDVLRHITPSVLATDLPPELIADVLQVGIDHDSFSPTLVVNTLGSSKIAEHLPLPILWNCISEAAQEIINDHPVEIKKKRTDEHEIVEPGDVLPEEMFAEEMPEIEVLEE
jgi:hypothetical protein